MDIFESFQISGTDTLDNEGVYRDINEEDVSYFDLLRLKEVINDGVYVHDEDIWFVSCDDTRGFDNLENPIVDSSFEFMSSGKNAGCCNFKVLKNMVCKQNITLFGFTIFKFLYKNNLIKEGITIKLDDGVNAVSIDFVREEREYEKKLTFLHYPIYDR